jgi:hypothetical protein
MAICHFLISIVKDIENWLLTLKNSDRGVSWPEGRKKLDHKSNSKLKTKPFEAEARLNKSPYREENTTLHHYKDQLLNAV